MSWTRWILLLQLLVVNLPLVPWQGGTGWGGEGSTALTQRWGHRLRGGVCPELFLGMEGAAPEMQGVEM